MLKFLVPQLSRSDLLRIMCLAISGAIVAGLYGATHDQITYSLAPEYFTNFKFEQFRFVPIDNHRLKVGVVGFLAAWWVGFLMTWFLARRHFPSQSPINATRRTLAGMVVVAACTAGAGLLAYVYGAQLEPNSESSTWDLYQRRFNIADIASFIRVAYIHNASYIGAALGFALALVLARPDNN